MLLFQVGTMQYGIGLPLVKDIKSAKPIVAEETESAIRFTRMLDGKETPLYDLVAMFGEKAVSHDYENEKLIMVEMQGHLFGHDRQRCKPGCFHTQ